MSYGIHREMRKWDAPRNLRAIPEQVPHGGSSPSTMLAHPSGAANILEVSLSPGAARINMAEYSALLFSQSIEDVFQSSIILRWASRNMRACQRCVPCPPFPDGLRDFKI